MNYIFEFVISTTQIGCIIYTFEEKISPIFESVFHLYIHLNYIFEINIADTKHNLIAITFLTYSNSVAAGL